MVDTDKQIVTKTLDDLTPRPRLMGFNVNHYVRVNLTEEGRRVYDGHYRELGLPTPKLVTDKNGRVRFQLWELMNIFGRALFNGGPVPFNTTIQLEVND